MFKVNNIMYLTATGNKQYGFFYNKHVQDYNQSCHKSLNIFYKSLVLIINLRQSVLHKIPL